MKNRGAVVAISIAENGRPLHDGRYMASLDTSPRVLLGETAVTSGKNGLGKIMSSKRSAGPSKRSGGYSPSDGRDAPYTKSRESRSKTLHAL